MPHACTQASGCTSKQGPFTGTTHALGQRTCAGQGKACTTSISLHSAQVQPLGGGDVALACGRIANAVAKPSAQRACTLGQVAVVAESNGPSHALTLDDVVCGEVAGALCKELCRQRQAVVGVLMRPSLHPADAALAPGAVCEGHLHCCWSRLGDAHRQEVAAVKAIDAAADPAGAGAAAYLVYGAVCVQHAGAVGGLCTAKKSTNSIQWCVVSNTTQQALLLASGTPTRSMSICAPVAR